MTAVTLAAAELKRVARDRTFLFFLIVLPILVILLVGVATAGSQVIRVGLVPGQSEPMATQLVRDLEDDAGLTTQRYATRADGIEALRRGEVTAVVTVPSNLDADLRTGRAVEVPVLVSGSVEASQAAVAGVSSVVARHGAAVQAALFATSHTDRGFGENLATTTTLQRQTPVVPVLTEVVNSGSSYLPRGYSSSAPTMLTLFVFINAVAGVER